MTMPLRLRSVAFWAPLNNKRTFLAVVVLNNNCVINGACDPEWDLGSKQVFLVPLFLVLLSHMEVQKRNEHHGKYSCRAKAEK